MLKKCLAIVLCIVMVLSLITMPAVFAEGGDLFSDDFESYPTGTTTFPTGGTSQWNSAYGAVYGLDPLNASNHVAEFPGTLAQKWPSLHKTVAMAVGTTTLFSGRVLLHSSAATNPSFYLEFRNSVDGSSTNRQQIFNVSKNSITLLNDKNNSFGSIVPDKWISYAAYITPGREGAASSVLVVLNSPESDGLKDKNGNLVSSITMEGEKVMDTVAVFRNNAGNMVHNNSIPVTEDGDVARTYLDDVRIYNTASLSSDATLSSLSYNGTPITGFDPERTTYNIRLDADVTTVSLSGLKNDAAAQDPIYSTAVLTDFPGSISVTVTAEAGNTKVYTVYFSRRENGAEMAADIMSTKGNVGAIATIISDDGVISSGQILDQLTQQYKIPLSCALIVSRLFNDNNLAKWQEIESHGWIEVINHSWTHPDRMSDSATYANLECNTEAGLQRELVDSKNYFEQNFETDAISFAAPNNSMSTRGYQIMKAHAYYSARLGSRGYNTLSPSEGTAAGQWMNLYMQAVGDGANNTAMRNNWIDTVIRNGQWVIEMWHNVSEDGTGGYQPISRADAETHIAYMVQQRAAGKLWIAGIVEATKYIREAQVSTASAVKTADGKVQAAVNYPDDALPTEIFDYPLTVRIEVPEDWGAATITQNGVRSTATVFEEDNVNYVYADIVPNQGEAVLEDAGASNLLSNIRLNGVSITDFNPLQNTYEIEKQASELPVEIVAEPLNSRTDVTLSTSNVITVPTTVTITLSGDEVETNVYTLNFIRKKSTNNLLSSITVNGKAVDNFDAEELSYAVTTEGTEESATIVATPADAMAQVSYAPSDTVALPATVTITVTAENGSTKKYEVIVKSRGDDIEYLYDSFDTYAENKQVSEGKWDGFNFSASTTN